MKKHIPILLFVAALALPAHADTHTAPTAQAPASAQPAQQAGTETAAEPSTAYTFVPLTNLPGVQDASRAETFPNFFNILYRLCIGAAAVLAVLQIMRAGMYFMFNKGSVAHNEQAKRLISSSVLGLLLVLSPAIIFGLINPEILRLELDVSGIGRGERTETGAFIGRDNLYWIYDSTDRAQAAAQCRSAGGTIVYYCRTSDDAGRIVQQNEQCREGEGERASNACRASGNAPDTRRQCALTFDNITSTNVGQFCPTGTREAPQGCCSGDTNYANRCCGTPKGSAAPAPAPAPAQPQTPPQNQTPQQPTPAQPQPAPTTQNPAAALYTWHVFTKFGASGTPQPRKARRTFTTANSCQEHYQNEMDALSGHTYVRTVCACDKRIGEQPNCRYP